MKATVTRVPGGGFVARSDSNHSIPIDWSADSGGAGAASSPMELVLMALGACTAIDVVTILEKSRSSAESLRVELSAERRDDHPRIFTSVHVEFVLAGPSLSRTAIERAIKLSEEKYCSVSAMIGAAARITTSYRIEAPASQRVP